MKKLIIVIAVLFMFGMVSAKPCGSNELGYEGKYGPDIVDDRTIIGEVCVVGEPHFHIRYHYDPGHPVELVVGMIAEGEDGRWVLTAYMYFLEDELFVLRANAEGVYLRRAVPGENVEFFRNDMRKVLDRWLSKKRLGI